MNQARCITVVIAHMLAFSTGCREEVVPAPVQNGSRSTDPALRSFLEYYDPRYDDRAGLLQEEFSSPGYHSGIESGTQVHPTRESLIYAVGLLRRERGTDGDRAAKIVRTVLGLQDVDPSSPTCGVWPWVLEEPIGEMDAPDLNWADFCGALLAQVLVDHSAQLPRELQQSMRESLVLAARAIRERDVGPAYTNIAILGGAVCAACGEIEGNAELLAYGRERLQRVVAHTQQEGSFNEYNSPPYTCVALGECERALQLIRDPETRAAAESLRRTAWGIIADSFHPATQQWAGPHSRTSRDRLRPRTVAFLARRTGVDLRVHPSMIHEDMPSRYSVVDALPCPDEHIESFVTIENEGQNLQRTFIRGESPAESVIGTTWIDEDCCLGSVNRETFWTQRKPLIGYWSTEHDPAVVFRVRFLHDGRDFASMGLCTSQDGPRSLSLIGPVRGQGDWHTRLDRPANGVFEAGDLRLRCELRGESVGCESLPGGRFVLAAGERRVVLHTLPGRFAGYDVVWELGTGENHVFVDAICYRGAPHSFDFNGSLDVQLGMGIELLGANETAAEQSPTNPFQDASGVTTDWSIGEGESLSVHWVER